MEGTPWEPAENLNRVAPAGVSLVVTGCSQGPVGPLNSAGEKLSPRSVILPQHSQALLHKSICLDIYRFLLAKCLCNHWKYKLAHLLIDLDSGPHRNSWKCTNGQFSTWILKDIKSWPEHLVSYHYVQYF